MAALRDLIKAPNLAELDLIARYGAFSEDARRERAFLAFAGNGLPHRRMEDWRWTDVKAALAELKPGSTSVRADPLQAGDAVIFRITPGQLIIPANLPPGVRVLPQPHIQAMGSAEFLPMAALAAALSGGTAKPGTLQVEIIGAVTPRLHFVFEGAGAANFARTICLLRGGASVHISESYLGGAGLTSALCAFTLEAGAHLTRTLFQSGGAGEVVAATTQVELWDGAVFDQTTLSLGAKLARLETRVTYAAPSAAANLGAAYLVSAGLHADVTTHVQHGARACTTRQITKGAVRAGGRGVFQGKFHVPRNAGQQTDADMQHNALLLEDGAEVFARPELEIHADDVQCAHGNTCGALDPVQLFYLRQRGIGLDAARALLTRAFIAQALDGAGELQDALMHEVDAWFTR
jgi:Fe-S cluster assembly protein SufD